MKTFPEDQQLMPENEPENCLKIRYIIACFQQTLARNLHSASHIRFLFPRQTFEYLSTMNRSFLQTLFLSLSVVAAWSADNLRVRKPNEDVNSSAVRTRRGLEPNETLLFNGWGSSPAGEHVPITDMAYKLVFAPDKSRLLAVNGGYNKQGVTLIDPATRQVTQFLSLTQSFNGLA